jgi:hypothetical protein
LIFQPRRHHSGARAGVSESDVNRVGQWRKVELEKGRQAGGSMREHYRELVQLLEARLSLVVPGLWVTLDWVPGLWVTLDWVIY